MVDALVTPPPPQPGPRPQSQPGRAPLGTVRAPDHYPPTSRPAPGGQVTPPPPRETPRPHRDLTPGRRVCSQFQRPSTPRATDATFSPVNPKCLYKAPAGADAPKPCMHTMSPASPTQR